jgi:transcriptional regulator with XRE-family HTH domain
MDNKNTPRRHSNPNIRRILNETPPVEKLKVRTKMELAARIDDLIMANGWGKSSFAEKVSKQPSEITKWLSGTQNFTIDTLVEIAFTLNIPLVDLFEQKQMQNVQHFHLAITLNIAQNQPLNIPIYPLHTVSDANAQTINLGFLQQTVSSKSSKYISSK